jgi:hypothetical protein
MKDGHGNPLSPEAEIKARSSTKTEVTEPNPDALVEEIATKHGVGAEAVAVALAALRRGNGTMAQFSHPDFGGMAQWSKGGMSMTGDMFNSATKQKLDGVLSDLSEALGAGKLAKLGDTGSPENTGSAWWPSEYGSPSSAGSQNNMRYAFFPDASRLIVEGESGRKIYDTGEHMISGVSQQQSTAQSLTFQSQLGVVRLDQLREAK